MSSKKPSNVKPIEVNHILTNNGAMAAKPSPVEHVTSPTTSTHSVHSSSERRSFQGHARNMSVATSESGASRSNRFSVSFPVQSSGSTSPTRMTRSPTREMAPPIVPEALASPTGPTDTTFLTAIATQERRVLELKEELQRAEADLAKLKRQWAQHEANKKRNDARRITKLQTVQAVPSTTDKEEDGDGSSTWMQQEMERRKALLNGGRNSNRTVFSGSRHTRTLSLLSPARENSGDSQLGQRQPPPPPPTRKDSLQHSAKHSLETERPQAASRPALLARASTTPDLTTEVAETADQSIDLPNNIDQALDHEALLRTGKKMATDFKDGLWTFLEDLRQATVGDEATQHEIIVPPAHIRKQASTQTLRGAKKSSKSSLRPSSQGSIISGKSVDTTKRPSPARKHTKAATQSALPDLANPGFWTDNGVTAPKATVTQAVRKSPTARGHIRSPSSKAPSISSTDAWDTWDDHPPPKDSRSSSTVSDTNTLPSTVSGSASPRPSMEKKDPIPWPALSKLGPATLRRTASHLMSEWERSLTPSPGKEFTGQDDYLGLSAEAAAMRVGRKVD